MSIKMSIGEIRHIAGLAELELRDNEAEQAGRDMEEMLLFVDKLKELDTEGTEAMPQVLPLENVFREDAVTNEAGSFDLLSTAPAHRNGALIVPKAVE